MQPATVFTSNALPTHQHQAFDGPYLHTTTSGSQPGASLIFDNASFGRDPSAVITTEPSDDSSLSPPLPLSNSDALPSPSQTPATEHGRSAPPAHAQRSADSSITALKRQRNTLAARKYRQKRLDRIKELEDALEVSNRERDDLRLRLVRQEAETQAMREMLKLRR